jgi:hypothetical protein
VSRKELEGFHSAHAAYVFAQNQVSVMLEQLTALKEMRPFVDMISKAEDLYVPHSSMLVRGQPTRLSAPQFLTWEQPSECTQSCCAWSGQCSIREWVFTFTVAEKAT